MANDGGPAFPAWRQEYDIDLNPVPNPGMTLRDYFAAAALTGLVSTPESMAGMREVGKAYGMQVMEYAANVAYEMADGMLSARELKQETSSYDCGTGTNCGRDNCVAHGGHGGDS